MKKKLIKLKLNKETITELTNEDAKNLKGGGYTWPTISTVAGFTYNTNCSYGEACMTKVDPCTIIV